ncbi:hypothetical protein F4604DRAFT_1261619 [Suillus subluteus]|nr:hypothetical protein F4604DRAFT_1261619 [Suillus subluteus]
MECSITSMDTFAVITSPLNINAVDMPQLSFRYSHDLRSTLAVSCTTMSKLSFTVPKLPAADHDRVASDKFKLSVPSSSLQCRKLCFWLPTHGFSSYFQLWRIPMSRIVLADGGVKMSQTLAMMKTTVSRTSLSLLSTSLVHSGASPSTFFNISTAHKGACATYNI